MPESRSVVLRQALERAKLGELVAARKIIQPLADTGDVAANGLLRQILYRQMASAKGDQRALLRQELESKLLGIDPELVSLRDLKIAKGLEFYSWLESYYKGKDQQVELAGLYFLSNENGRAEQLYNRLIEENKLNEAAFDRAIKQAMAAGSPSIAVEWMLKKPSRDQGYYNELLKMAQIAGRQDITSLPSDIFPENFPGKSQWLEEAVKSNIAQGQLDDALVLTNQLIKQQADNPEYRKNRRKLLIWLNRSAESVEDSKWLIANTDEKTVFRDSIDLFGGLYQYDEITRLFRKHAESNRLSEDQLDKWMQSHEMAGTPEQAISDLESYGQRYGNSKATLRWLVKIYSDTYQGDKVRSLFAEVKQKGVNDYSTLYRLAMTYVYVQKYEEAVSTLKLISDSSLSRNRQAYWQLFSELASRTGRKSDIAVSYEGLQGVKELGNVELQRYADSKFGENSSAKIDWYKRQYMKSPSFPKLLAICNLISSMDSTPDISLYAKWAGDYAGQPGLENVWMILGQYHLRNGNNKMARKYLNNAIAIKPDFDEALQSLGWLALSSS